MKIDRCLIENFTVFEKQKIEFCPGINIIIGPNGAGKSHLLKILYSLTKGEIDKAGDTSFKNSLSAALTRLIGVFRPEDENTSLLIRNRDDNATANIKVFSTEKDTCRFTITSNTSNCFGVPLGARHPSSKAIFVPPNDVLAIYPGFTAAWELRELAFDQTYYDICKALSAAPLKKQHVVLSRLILGLEDILQGDVVQKGDHFYVEGKNDGRRLEAHLLAEGHRKIATLVHLIRNGSIDSNTILFWDEPEANMNPRLIKHIAVLLRELANVGVQIFISTHDYLLTGELSLAAEYETAPKVPIRFLAINREGDEPVQIQNGDTLADLQDNPILDEFADHYQREQDAVIQHMKAGTPA